MNFRKDENQKVHYTKCSPSEQIITCTVQRKQLAGVEAPSYGWLRNRVAAGKTRFKPSHIKKC